MKSIVLYFSDAINLKAFMLMENPRSASVDETNLLMKGNFTERQINKALGMYGATLSKS